MPVLALVGVSTYLGPANAPASAPAMTLADCPLKLGGDLNAPTWADTRLGFRRVWPITQGAGVRVAVIDSGVSQTVPQLKGIHYSDALNVLNKKAPVYDCTNHGTGVTAIIAGQPAGTPFSGVAPKATIIPIKMSDSEENTKGTTALAAAIRAAVDAHARVANLSVYVNSPDAGVRSAVEYAQAHHLILVCAGGNAGTGNNQPTYPAAWSGTYDNIIAVSATDQQDSAANFSESGHYIDVAAPGDDVITPYSGGGFGKQSGTSFATPYVTGTVALMLQAHPGMTPEQVRNRLEATADPPPAAVPDAKYGYGVIDPYLAVTAVRSDTPVAKSTARAAPLPALPVPKATDRHLQHLALALAAGLIGLAVVIAAAATVLRSSRRTARQPFARRS